MIVYTGKNLYKTEKTTFSYSIYSIGIALRQNHVFVSANDGGLKAYWSVKKLNNSKKQSKKHDELDPKP